MILIRRYELRSGVPISPTIVARIKYRSGDREEFRNQQGFDPYDEKEWARFLIENPQRFPVITPNKRVYVYQVYRWGRVNKQEPYPNQSYVSILPRTRENQTTTPLRDYWQQYIEAQRKRYIHNELRRR